MKKDYATGINRLNYNIHQSWDSESITYQYLQLLHLPNPKSINLEFFYFLKSPNIFSILNTENDSKLMDFGLGRCKSCKYW
jgi:hypothetical protein